MTHQEVCGVQNAATSLFLYHDWTSEIPYFHNTGLNVNREPAAYLTLLFFSGAVIPQEYTVSLLLYCQTLQRLIFEAGIWHSRIGLLHRIHFFSPPEGPSKKTSLWKTLLLSANLRLNIASGKLCERKV